MIFSVDGVKIYAAVMGEGPALLCIHGGFGLDHSYFLPGLSPLAEQHQLILLDLRGHGRGDPLPPEHFRMERINADLEAIRTQLGLDHWAVLGHSGGGLLAANYTAAHPDRVSHFIVMGGFPEFPFDAPDWWATAQRLGRPEIEHGFQLFLRGVTTDAEYRAACLAIAPLFFADPQRADVRPFEQIIYRVTPFNEAMRCYSGVNLGERIRGYPGPALILHGLQDYRVPAALAQRWCEYLPQAEWCPLDGVGHFPSLDGAEATCRKLRRFLAGNPA